LNNGTENLNRTARRNITIGLCSQEEDLGNLPLASADTLLTHCLLLHANAAPMLSPTIYLINQNANLVTDRLFIKKEVVSCTKKNHYQTRKRYLHVLILTTTHQLSHLKTVEAVLV
jgi:hypothetical protein